MIFLTPEQTRALSTLTDYANLCIEQHPTHPGNLMVTMWDGLGVAIRVRIEPSGRKHNE